MIVIAGQCKTATMVNGERMSSRRIHGVRQLGVNELDMVEIMKPVTKYAATVFDSSNIRYHLEHAYAKAMDGRKGPVFLEIPLDVQNAEIDPADFAPIDQRTDAFRSDVLSRLDDSDVARVVSLLSAAERPVLIVGNGIHLVGRDRRTQRLVHTLQIPVISSWNGSDLIDNDHPCYIGRIGIFGDRASNFAVQNADLVLAIGCRLSIPQIGHDTKLFAPNAKKIVVDIDFEEAAKDTVRADLPICADAKEFIRRWIVVFSACQAIGGIWEPGLRSVKLGKLLILCAPGAPRGKKWR